MKLHRAPGDLRLNSRTEMAERLVFVLQLGAWIAAGLLLALAWERESWRLVAQALICAVLAWAGRRWLRRRDRWANCRHSFAAMFSSWDGAALDLDTPGADRLAALVERRERLEASRGTPGFDPWELQQVRHAITELVRNNPRLADRLDDDFPG